MTPSATHSHKHIVNLVITSKIMDSSISPSNYSFPHFLLQSYLPLGHSRASSFFLFFCLLHFSGLSLPCLHVVFFSSEVKFYTIKCKNSKPIVSKFHLNFLPFPFLGLPLSHSLQNNQKRRKRKHELSTCYPQESLFFASLSDVPLLFPALAACHPFTLSHTQTGPFKME